MKTKLVIFFAFAFVGILLFAKEIGVDQHLLSDFGKMTGERYLKQRGILSAKELERKRFDMPKSFLCKAMLSILELHNKHLELCKQFDKYKEKLSKREYDMITYTRGNYGFISYVYKHEKGKPNPEYQKFIDQQTKKEAKTKSEKNKATSKADSQKHNNVDAKKNVYVNEKTQMVLIPRKDLKMPENWINKPPRFLPLPKEKMEEKKKRASWARIRLLEYALKETNKPHELYSILLMNPYIKPQKQDANYESAQALYDYVILRYIYNLDIILSEMGKKDKRLRKVYKGNPRYMYTVEKALTLLDKNKLYGTISLLKELRKHFEVNPKKNKIIINAINKKIEEFRTKNAKEIQWISVFERVNTGTP